ncbi:MAG: hypothetical protein ABSD67_06100 [Terracidiphilus sp.]|jgi:hypothetical protein
MSEITKTDRTHTFNALAKVIEGTLHMPLAQTIPTQAHAALDDTGGYRVQHTTDYRLEGLISLSAGHSQVSGSVGSKPGHGWSTLVTTVIEDLNVMQVVIADRVVGQIITEHPLVGYVPTISFLGTWFESLRIAGHPVHLDLDLDLIGPKPANDGSYIRNPEFLSRVSNQYSRILGIEDLPEDLREKYNQLAANLGKTDTVECSLVNSASGTYPGRTYGNIIRIPEFGTVNLGKLIITQEDPDPVTGVLKKTTVTITMIDLKLGCAIEGDVPIGGGSSNGTTMP